MVEHTKERSSLLDAIRGIAILLVVGHHWLHLPYGWTGVDVFFVLSGYLIGGILIDNNNSTSYFRTFYARRIFRILPLYALFLVIVLPVFGSRVTIWHYLTFSQNFSQASIGPTGEIPELTWSLAVEEQFYLVLPFIVWVTTLRSLALVSACLIAAAPFCRIILAIWFGQAWAAYVLMPCRMDALFAGVLVACIVRAPTIRQAVQRKCALLWAWAALSWIGFVTVYAHGRATPLMLFGGFSLLASAFSCALLAAVISEPQGHRRSLLSFAGLGAYSTYLFHRPIHDLVQTAMPLQTGWVLALSAAATCGVATACWLLVERPCIRWASARWPYRAQPVALSCQIATVTDAAANTLLDHRLG